MNDRFQNMFKLNQFKLVLLLTLSLGLFFSCNSSQKKEDSQNDQTEINEKTDSNKTILFFGNSITAGYGIDKDEAFAGLIQAKIDSLGLGYKVINGGLSGETTASGLNRIDWFLEEKPDIFVLELGANDGLRGIDLSETQKNLEKIIEVVKGKYPETKVVLAGMQIPPNMGKEYTSTFKTIFPEIAREKEVTLIPFLLEGVAGNPQLNQADGIHPTKEGHRIIAKTVWEYLQPLL